MIGLDLAVALMMSAGNTEIGIQREATITLEVAQEYELSPYQTAVLCALRSCENGKRGNEWGCMDMYPESEAHRFRNGPASESVRVQARWAAGTIKKRLPGDDLEAFMKRWNFGNWEHELGVLKRVLARGGVTA